MRLGASLDEGRVECFAIPLKPGSTRRRTRWGFLFVTTAPERAVRETLVGLEFEVLDRRGANRVLMAWPGQA